MIIEPTNRGVVIIQLSQIESILLAARSKTTIAERSGYLDRACGTDAELRRQVELLLEAFSQATVFSGSTAFEPHGAPAHDREPRPSSVSPDPYSTIVDDNPALRTVRPEDNAVQHGRPDSSLTTLPDGVIDLAPIADHTTIRDDTQSEREHNGRSPFAKDDDFRTEADPLRTIAENSGPIADSGATVHSDTDSLVDPGLIGDVAPKKSTGSMITDRIVTSTAHVRGDKGDIGDLRTVEAGDADPYRTVEAGDVDPFRTVQAGDADPYGTFAAGDEISFSPGEGQTRLRTDGPSIPGYEILGTLGRGGMGVVYKARQIGLNRLVALKMIIGGSMVGARALARFRIEAEAVAQLRHPNIVQIYDIGEVDGMPFVSLELLEGGDLKDRLVGTPQPGLEATVLLATLARAIHAAHQARIVHRDLKPPNVLLTADGQPKISDFGLAKRLEADDDQTKSGDIMGTPSYMAPEQALGHTKDVGPAADIYALGAIFYEVLTGRPPHKGETVMETVRLAIHEEPVAPSRLVPRLARDLETICLKCLNKDPQKRYISAEALADDLDRYREGKPIEARPTSTWERGLKWSKRRPLAAAVLAVGTAMFIGLTAGVIGYQRYNLLEKERRNTWVDRQNKIGLELLDQADHSRAPLELQKAQVDLAKFLQVARDELRLRPISLRIQAKQNWVGDRLEELSSRDAAEERDRVTHERFQKFLELRQEAQLYAAGFGVLVATDRLEKLRASAHAALTIYAQDPQAPDEVWSLAKPLPAELSQTDKAKVADDCYDLLLIRSQAAEPAQGLQVLDRAVRLRPQPTAAYHRRRAECLERAGDLAGRDREIREASLIKPVTALDYFLSGRELLLRRRFADAVRPLNSALQADPEKTSAHLLLAVCYLNMQPKGLSQAKTSLTNCIRSHRDLVALYLMRALVSGEEGNEALEKIARERPDDEAEIAGLRQEAKDAIAAAEADYRQALDLKPNDDLRYVLLANRGLMWLQSKRLDLAVADLTAAIWLKPSLFQAHTTLAQVYARQGRLEDAAASFGRAIDCRPEPIVLSGLYRSRALLHGFSDLTADQRKVALRDLEDAIRHEPENAPKARDHVARARLFIGGGQPQEALAACELALALIPDDSEAHRMRISALMELKRYDEVLASADAYIARGEPSPVIFEIRGLAREVRKDFTAAISDFNGALELTPGASPEARTRLLNLRGWAYQFADAPRLALSDFAESLRLNPNQSDALGGRGLARIRLGDWRPAVTDVEAAVRLATAKPPQTVDERQARSQALFNAARVYALAVDFAAGDVSRQGERAIALYRSYRSRALGLLDEALKYAPDKEYRDTILSDRALRSLRRATSRAPAPRVGSLGISPRQLPSTS
jgi:eukaryotic-like serine/threonine-protein kinase